MALKWYPSKVKQKSGKWKKAHAARIYVDDLWMVKYLLSGSRERLRVQPNRYLVNYGSRTTPLFVVADMGDVKRIKT